MERKDVTALLPAPKKKKKKKKRASKNADADASQMPSVDFGKLTKVEREEWNQEALYDQALEILVYMTVETRKKFFAEVPNRYWPDSGKLMTPDDLARAEFGRQQREENEKEWAKEL
jgi:hypothetical protein